MSGSSIGAAFSNWPRYNRSFRESVAGLSDEQLAASASPERWPLWAIVGHTACQRVFWLCDFAGEPGAETTPFTDAARNCPGDDDLEHVLDARRLGEALDSTFRIVDACLDRWTIEMLAEMIRRDDFGPDWVHSRGSVIQRVFAHDIYHMSEVSQLLGLQGLPPLDLWG
jgi:hypothetical protein